MRKLIVAGVLAVAAAPAIAQNNSIEPPAQNATDGATVSFSLVYNEGTPAMSGVTGRADVNGAVGDTASFDAASLACTAGAGFSCNTVGGMATCSGFQVGSTFADGSTIADCTVDLTTMNNPGDVATIQSLVQADSFSDMGGTDFMGTASNGTVTITAGSELVNNTAPQTIAAGTNSTSPTRDFTFAASGGPVTAITCVDDDGSDGVNWSFGGMPGSLADMGTGTVTGSCNTATNGSSTGTATCSGTGDQSNPTSATAQLTCDISSMPANPGVSTTAVTIGPAPAGATGSGGFAVVDREPSSTGFNVTCTVNSGSLTLTNASGTVTPSSPLNVGVRGAVQAGTVGTITCSTMAGTIPQITVTGLVAAVQVPTLSQWAMILMGLALVGFGAFRLRRGGFSA